MANFLITGARAPVALELARNLHRDGNNVYLADSLRFPLARGSRSVSKYFYIASPRRDIKTFTSDLKAILINENIDVLVPTCEEVFYIAAIKHQLAEHATVFCPGFDEIKNLHSKFQIYTYLAGAGLRDPGTELVTGSQLLSIADFAGKVVKKEFCRFGTGVLIEPSGSQVRAFVDDRVDQNFVIQNKVSGKEFCTYAIANKGTVSCIGVYEPTYRVAQSAGVYFSPVDHAKVEQAITHLCKLHNITGQIGFDLIVNDDGIFVLECNPRATSGLHLLSEAKLSACFLGEVSHLSRYGVRKRPKMIALAMLLVALPAALKNSSFSKWRKAFSEAEDVVSSTTDRSLWFLSLLSLLEICWTALRQGCSLRAASTVDIEWDGEYIDA